MILDLLTGLLYKGELWNTSPWQTSNTEHAEPLLLHWITRVMAIWLLESDALYFRHELCTLSQKMRACKFGRVRRLFWDWVPRDHKNSSIFPYLLHWATGFPNLLRNPPKVDSIQPFLLKWDFLRYLRDALLRPSSGLPQTCLTPARCLNELFVAYGPFSENLFRHLAGVRQVWGRP